MGRMHPHWRNDWGKSHPAERIGIGGPYNDGVFVPLFTIFIVIVMTYYAVVMMRRQMKDWREQREKRERTERMNSESDDD